MPLSVANPHGGSGLSNLLRQTRPARSGADAGATAGSEVATAATRPIGQATIDSTGAKTAQIKATLTLVLSRLDQGADAGPAKARAVGPAAPAARSGASEVLRVLDAYAADPLRLSA